MTKITVIEANDVFTHVAVKGKLDATGVSDVEAELIKQTFDRRKPAIVDICAVEILPSIGIGMLVKLARSMHSYGIIFGVVATGTSRDILERLRINSIFPVEATYEDARRKMMLE